MENGSEFRRWDELIPDALGLIFRNLSLEEILTVVPQVCKSWRKVVNGPYCWQEIDIEEWSGESKPQNIDRMVHMLVARSCGSLQKLCVCELSSDSFVFVVENSARALRTLRLMRSDISDTIVEQVAPKLSAITSLDLSYCSNIGARALESFGKHCKLLTWLCRNMRPIDMDERSSQNEEAHAIATWMPNLKQLEMGYFVIDTGSVLEILNNCLFLQSLDLRGCWNVKLDNKLVKEKFPGLKILGPGIIDPYYEFYSDFSESYYDSDSFDGMWDEDESLELRFYEEFDENASYGWPLSP